MQLKNIKVFSKIFSKKWEILGIVLILISSFMITNYELLYLSFIHRNYQVNIYILDSDLITFLKNKSYFHLKLYYEYKVGYRNGMLPQVFEDLIYLSKNNLYKLSLDNIPAEQLYLPRFDINENTDESILLWFNTWKTVLYKLYEIHHITINNHYSAIIIIKKF